MSLQHRTVRPCKALRFGAALLVALVTGCLALANGFGGQDASPTAEFQFVRLVYTDSPDRAWRRRGSWLTDAPEAETHFLGGVRRLTRVNAAAEGRALQIMDEELFDYPFLYAVEVGHWVLSDEEAQRLREFLLRGGFLMLDDFHGTLEWEVFLQSMQRVFPDLPIVEIPEDNEIFHVLYQVDHRTQIPNVWTTWCIR